MDLRIFTEPQQGASYDTLLAVAKATETAGFSAFFRSDHYMAFSGDGQPGPTDAFITLAGLARDTERIRLGTLVTAATFRNPGSVAISVAQIDHMSGGRVEFSLGAAWNDREHQAYGLPFPSTGERFEILEEQLAVITGLWRTPPGDTFSFEGKHYRLRESPALPKPLQIGGPPVIVGGGGPKKTPRLAATYADEFNVPFAPMEFWIQQRARVRDACRAIDRDPDELTYSVALTVAAGADEAEARRRAEAIGQAPERLATSGLCGTPGQILDRLGEWREAGAERVYLQVLDLADLDHIGLLGEQVLPGVH